MQVECGNLRYSFFLAVVKTVVNHSLPTILYGATAAVYVRVSGDWSGMLAIRGGYQLFWGIIF
jgi:hypothetical protein